MHIQPTLNHEFISETLQEMRLSLPPLAEEKCPHCGIGIRFPLIARQGDVELFEMLLKSASEVMERHGITANLFADIRTQCVINIAKRNQ